VAGALAPAGFLGVLESSSGIGLRSRGHHLRRDTNDEPAATLTLALTLAMSQLGCRPAPAAPGLKWTKRKDLTRRK
jgi:hypothetical protein